MKIFPGGGRDWNGGSHRPNVRPFSDMGMDGSAIYNLSTPYSLCLVIIHFMTLRSVHNNTSLLVITIIENKHFFDFGYSFETLGAWLTATDCAIELCFCYVRNWPFVWFLKSILIEFNCVY